MPDDGLPLTADDVEAAASVGRLPALARQLVLDGSWASLDVALTYTRGTRLPLAEMASTVRAITEAVAALPPGRRQAAADECKALQRQAAAVILGRLERDPLTAAERNALVLAGTILFELGEAEPAAQTFERAGDDLRAADAYGALGDLERMEACLARDEGRRTRRQSISAGLRTFETLLAGGDRRAAMAVAATVPEDDFEGAGVRAQAAEIERRLCRGRGVSLRLPDGNVVRFARAPAVLGRDPACEIPLRDPAVSRRHARLALAGASFTVEDLGSRAGTSLAGAAVRTPVTLPELGELTLGDHGPLRFRTIEGPRIELVGTEGLDRGLRAVVGTETIPIAEDGVLPRGLSLRLSDAACRLEWDPSVSVHLEDRLIGRGCDLLHGDVIEVAGARLEIL